MIIFAILFLTYSFTSISDGFGSTSCTAQSGYTCANSKYLSSTADIAVTLGQNTGTNWASANFVFVPHGTHFSNNVPSISFTMYPANTLYSTSQLISGQAVVLYLPVNGVNAPIKVGTLATGTIWVAYTTTSSGPINYVQMASINIKAT